MKALTIALLSFVVTSAHASWMTTKCSNSDGTVIWEKGSDENTINLKYSNFIEGTLTLDIEQVNIESSKEVTVKEQKIRNCSYEAYMRVYAGMVRITASDKHPDVLRSLFPLNKVETEVICTHMMSTPKLCPSEQ